MGLKLVEDCEDKLGEAHWASGLIELCVRVTLGSSSASRGQRLMSMTWQPMFSSQGQEKRLQDTDPVCCIDMQKESMTYPESLSGLQACLSHLLRAISPAPTLICQVGKP